MGTGGSDHEHEIFMRMSWEGWIGTIRSRYKLSPTSAHSQAVSFSILIFDPWAEISAWWAEPSCVALIKHEWLRNFQSTKAQTFRGRLNCQLHVLWACLQSFIALRLSDETPFSPHGWTSVNDGIHFTKLCVSLWRCLYLGSRFYFHVRRIHVAFSLTQWRFAGGTLFFWCDCRADWSWHHLWTP